MAFGNQLRAGLEVSVPSPPGADSAMEIGRDLEHRKSAAGRFGKKGLYSQRHNPECALAERRQRRPWLGLFLIRRFHNLETAPHLPLSW